MCVAIIFLQFFQINGILPKIKEERWERKFAYVLYLEITHVLICAVKLLYVYFIFSYK